MPTSNQEYDAEALYRELLGQVRAGLDGVPDAAIVGIHSGGAWLAERLAKDLDLTSRFGTIDVSFYRDDYAKKGLHPDVKPTHIRFAVDGATIVLVDDVLQTGRTVRAAINVLFDYGRPSCIRLAALADRGGRELPVAPDYVGTRAELAPHQSLCLQRGDAGQLSLTIEEDQSDNAETV
ncbi:bifunctional pyr operon transcriptional regulator/uracil phosphoribosyltransferase PyrR [Massilia sp. IC2-477]|uniref:bifunctional pyr operon transcriptional regulator/uracil phosphoribosyltransferase PyrR n=1 Tax=unclassified Massilia TaxID=2609279 RepID=UPI001D105F17|nr:MULTISPECIES: bifunctional pyr operon transcriptional regulator/uracil phosphoribosyltransferase PyrR [unclassified Massilia]MCC2956682.1 bifunctional pyr operon transcriptional regulator/uracil phosphoribosyltransferase PyrR [Massilia sp. IC2-477]MCC2973098.1 bifunctional pyr operon transcriptional regulator/uracil phosphoribosyltransferase PyrR [Massilia sp. IC2-476]